MSTDSDINRPIVPPKPKVPPKPPRDERWRRATDVILRTELREEGEQDRKQQMAKHKSLPAVVIGSPALRQTVDQNSGQLNARTPPTSPIRVRPVPKPRLRRTPALQNSQSLSEGSADSQISIPKSQSIRGSTHSSNVKLIEIKLIYRLCYLPRLTYQNHPLHKQLIDIYLIEWVRIHP